MSDFHGCITARQYDLVNIDHLVNEGDNGRE